MVFSPNLALRNRVAALAFVSLLALPIAPSAHAQDAPAPSSAPSAPQPKEIPPAPAADAANEPVFPKTTPADFTADSPTREQVAAFLQASWGYDTKRVYQVQRILKTNVPGITNVLIVVGEKGNKQVNALQFFALPDGKHIITANELLPFGAHPFTENRDILMKRADGPSRGATGKELELVEFADFQCPHCKDAQATMDKLVTDFPQAHIVYESFPLVDIHPQAFRSAAYGVCVAKLGGNKAFFDYAAAVYDGQAGLATDEGATLTLNGAVSKSGQTPDAIEKCSKTPETKSAVDASVQLAKDLGVNQTPSLAINGRIIPVGGIPYDTLKDMINYQIKMDAGTK